MSTTSSALQDTTARGAYRRVVASYRWYKYYDNLSQELSVINDTSAKMTYVVYLHVGNIFSSNIYLYCPFVEI